VGRGHRGHRRCVDDAQVLCTAHAQLGIEHGIDAWLGRYLDYSFLQKAEQSAKK
jgi:hypothetical protein